MRNETRCFISKVNDNSAASSEGAMVQKMKDAYSMICPLCDTSCFYLYLIYLRVTQTVIRLMSYHDGRSMEFKRKRSFHFADDFPDFPSLFHSLWSLYNRRARRISRVLRSSLQCSTRIQYRRHCREHNGIPMALTIAAKRREYTYF